MALDDVPDTAVTVRQAVTDDGALLPAGVDSPWLARAGRFANPVGLTNTLGVADDAQAVRLFLRERTSHSRNCSPAQLQLAVKFGPRSLSTVTELISSKWGIGISVSTTEMLPASGALDHAPRSSPPPHRPR